MVSDQTPQEVLAKRKIKSPLLFFCLFWLITYSSVEYHTKIVNQTFPIEKVVRCEQEVPGEGTEPWETVYPVDGIADIDDFFETFHLYYQCLRKY